MKILTIIFCLFLSVKALAQRNDTPQKVYVIRDKATIFPTKQLIVVDGVVYNDSISTINSNTILKKEVLTGTAATALYGVSGSNGVIVIKTKSRIISDTSKVLIRDAQYNSKDPLYIVDGKVVPSVSNIKAADIMETSILPDSTAMKQYGTKASNGAMIITTVAGAISIYEQKFSAFNKRYKSYLEKHHGDDTKLAYVINNTILMEKGKKTVGKLYDLEAKNIKKIDYRTDRRFTTDATIVITTTDDSN